MPDILSSPKTSSSKFHRPIYSITTISWVDPHRPLCSALGTTVWALPTQTLFFTAPLKIMTSLKAAPKNSPPWPVALAMKWQLTLVLSVPLKQILLCVPSSQRWSLRMMICVSKRASVKLIVRKCWLILPSACSPVMWIAICDEQDAKSFDFKNPRDQNARRCSCKAGSALTLHNWDKCCNNYCFSLRPFWLFRSIKVSTVNENPPTRPKFRLHDWALGP